MKTLRPKLQWFRLTTSFPPKKHCYNAKKYMETPCAAKLRPASGVCDASKARAPRFGPAASSSWCDWNFGIIHNICNSLCGWIIQLAKMRLNKPWVFSYTIIIQTDWQTHISRFFQAPNECCLVFLVSGGGIIPRRRKYWMSIEPSNPPTTDG